MNDRIIIIGAGMGGLSSSIALSGQPGAQITVLEAASGPGGKIGYGEHSGVRFDTGPSILTLPEIPRALFEAEGYDFDKEIKLVESTPNFRYYYPDGTALDIFNTLEDTSRSIEKTLGSKAKSEFDAFMTYAKRIWDAAAPNFIMGPAPNFGSMVRLGLRAIKELRDIDPMRSMAQAIESKISDPYLRSIFLRYATYNGSDPRKAPATLSCISWVELGMGCWGVAGGMRQLAATMERISRDKGTSFRYDSPVRSITRNQDGTLLVCLDGEELIADSVVVNADVAHLVNDLLGPPDDSGIKPPEAASMSGFNAVIKARRRSAARRPGHAVVFPDRDYMEEFIDIFDHHRAPLKPTIYLCAQEKAHASEGWSDHEPLFIMANAPPLRGPEDEIFDWTAYQEAIVTRLRTLDLIDHDDEVIWTRQPSGLASRFPGSRGSLYGAASNSTFDAFRRPSNRSAQIPGLYLAGGSAHPGGGVPLCIQSGRQAALEVIKDCAQARRRSGTKVAETSRR